MNNYHDLIISLKDIIVELLEDQDRKDLDVILLNNLTDSELELFKYVIGDKD